MTSKAGPDLVIIGGGVIGLASAREAARRGLSVAVLERGEPAHGATWAAAGMLSPLGEAHEAGPFLQFSIENLHAYASWAAEVEEESGVDLEYRESGKLKLALSDKEAERLARKSAWAEEHGLRVEWLDPTVLRRKEPAVALSVRSALLVHDDYQVDNRAVGRALVASCEREGVSVHSNTPVRSIRSRSGRVVGVELDDGREIDSRSVVVAAGAWTPRIAGLPRPVPVHPVRGQMMCLRPRTRISSRVLESEEVYLVARDDGRLLLGATVEEVGFEPMNTADGTRGLLNSALSLVPRLGSAAVVDLWSGFRPGSVDGNPIIGPDPELDGLIYATGHFRNGILLAPLTGRIVAALAAGDPVPAPDAAFSPSRPAVVGFSSVGLPG